jgi:hypothetical protein
LSDYDEKSKRKAILHKLRDDERRVVREGFPVSATVLKALFSFLGQRLSVEECDDTLRFSREFIAAHKLSEETVREWLESKGGFCDCEVLDNVEQVVEDAVPEYQNLIQPKE